MAGFSRGLPALSSVFSQLAQSALSLIATILFARLLSPSTFGILAIFWLIWMLWLSMNRSVFSEQLLASAASTRARRGYKSFVLIWLTAALTISLGASLPFGDVALLGGVTYIAFFVGSDAARYYVMAATGGRRGGFYGAAGILIVDVLRLLLALGALLTAFAGAPTALTLTLVNMSAGIWILCLIDSRQSFSLRLARGYVGGLGKFERAISLQFILGTGVSQAAPAIALLPFGFASVGAIRLTQTLLSPITLLTTAFQPTVIKLFAARKADEQGLRRLLLGLIASALLIGVLLASTAVVTVNLFGEEFIPAQYVDLVREICLPIAVMLAVAVVGQPGGAIIRVRRLGVESLRGQVIGSFTTLALCIAAAPFTLTHFVWALAAGSITTVCVTYALMAASELSKSRG
ncbi:hypothetical protein GC088_04650 [Arthrobacter sp. JZ12]|uniref:hypothetical protein n=1 Tax=Arthrobacter sp. JZ12 TaxID=2654190 RepID=UPI002B46A5BD|nr:hypothetical protein [Arthrobacter sp. JZ12]WRH24442.1 hypothetical protein GC088_04650 [Arthrobacter sp. JZ12]